MKIGLTSTGALLLCVLLAGCDGGGSSPQQPPPPQPQGTAPPPPTPLQGQFKMEGRGYWDIARTSDYAIIIPRNWSQITEQQPEAAKLYLVKRGVVDETGNPVEVGLMVEQFPSHPRSIDEEIERLITRYKQLEENELLNDPMVQNVQLADGTTGQLLLLEMLTKGKIVRRSVVVKLLATDETKNMWIVTGYVAAGSDSLIGTRESSIFQMLLTHVTSFSLDPQQVDERPIHEIYHAQAMPPAQEPQ